MWRRIRKIAGRSKEQAGLSLLEAIIALAVFSLIAVALLSGLATSARSNIISQEQTTAESLARGEIEYIQQQPYSDAVPPLYASLPDLPAGYSLVTSATTLDAYGLQLISVTVQRDSAELMKLEGYKVKK